MSRGRPSPSFAFVDVTFAVLSFSSLCSELFAILRSAADVALTFHPERVLPVSKVST